jgi:hypothetical protein
MRPRPFYRWKSFWLGILVLLVLGWAWKRSCEYLDYYRISLGPGLVVLAGQGASDLAVGWHSSPLEEGSYFIHHEADPSEPCFASAISWGSDSPGGAHVALAHWFLIVVFLVPWSAWLFYHWKREQKKSS